MAYSWRNKTKWRITSYLNFDSGAIKLEPASQFMFNGLIMQGTINNEIVTRYSGRGGTGQ